MENISCTDSILLVSSWYVFQKPEILGKKSYFEYIRERERDYGHPKPKLDFLVWAINNGCLDKEHNMKHKSDSNCKI